MTAIAWLKKAEEAIIAFNDQTPKKEGKEARLLRRVVTATKGLAGEGIHSNVLDLKLGVAEGAELTPVMRGLYLKKLGLSAKKPHLGDGEEAGEGLCLH
jgi:hypothetical protein